MLLRAASIPAVWPTPASEGYMKALQSGETYPGEVEWKGRKFVECHLCAVTSNPTQWTSAQQGNLEDGEASALLCCQEPVGKVFWEQHVLGP